MAALSSSEGRQCLTTGTWQLEERKGTPDAQGPRKVNPKPAMMEWVKAEVTQDCILCLSSFPYGQGLTWLQGYKYKL